MHPEIYWGEKPMDSTFLHYFFNLEKFPVNEPWASGHLMKYYYGGFFIFANILKLANVEPQIGYNLLVAIIPSLYFSGLVLVFKSLTVSSLYSILFSLLVCFSSNLSMLFLLINGKPLDSHTFWASTRVYTSPTFTEYPFWSFVFADLHPHVMCLPFVALFIFFVLSSFRADVSGRFRFQLIISMLLGFILIINSWDAISCALFFSFYFLFYYSRNVNLKELTKEIVYLLVLFSLAILPFYSQIKSNKSLNLLAVTQSELLTFSSIIEALGIWLLPLFLFFSFKHENKKTFFLSILMFLLAFLVDRRPVFLLSVLSILILFNSKINDKRVFTLGCFSFFFLILTDFFVLIDRMNSVFKFHYFLWTSLSIFSLSFLYLNSKSKKVLFVIPMLGILGSLASAYLVFTNGFHWNHKDSLRGLDGLSYLKDSNDYRIINWLKSNAKYDDVILEAHGPSYQNYTRISSYTGLQTVLGWSHHVSQRGVLRSEIDSRENDIKTVYESNDSNTICSLLKKYNVMYLVHSELESKTYNISQIKAGCLNEAFEYKQSRVYKVL